MKEIPLSRFVDSHGATFTAKAVGCSVPAILKAVKAEREIFISPKSGGFDAWEKKPFPSPSHLQAGK